MKNLVAIHDISCFGKCSLTVALPILSAGGVEAAVIPTAVLSTHTGGFTDFTYRDLTDDIMPIFRHWQSIGLTFDASYSGYLGSFRQLDIVAEINRELAVDGALIIVDPVMADHGELYSSFDSSFPAGMRKLCEQADIIVPNMTEAVLMLGEEYLEGPYTHEYVEGLLRRLAEIPRRLVVLTGVWFSDDQSRLGAACIDAVTGEVSYALAPRVPGAFHGTGDVFASALVAGILAERTPTEAMQAAVDFTAAAAQRTAENGTDRRFGVAFEPELHRLI